MLIVKMYYYYIFYWRFMSSSFYTLTPDRVIAAVEKCGFSPTGHYMVLNSYENRVYDLMLEDESHVIVKFYRPGRWNREQIAEEHKFLHELAADEITVCAPLAISGEETVMDSDGIFFAVWPRTGGRIPEELTNHDRRNIGRLVARIHNNGAASDSPRRLRLTGEVYGTKPLRYLAENNFLPAHCVKRYTDAVKEVVNIYSKLSADVPVHRIHGDCHMGNLLQRDGIFFFLDFDDFLTGPAVQDIWMLASSRGEDSIPELEVFLEGYREFRYFDSSWLKLIEPLRALRYINYAAWIARRWDDPAFPQIFPHFGTVDYWERETSDLEDQVDIIYSGDASMSGHKHEKHKPEEKELTNKDFFWDMD